MATKNILKVNGTLDAQEITGECRKTLYPSIGDWVSTTTNLQSKFSPSNTNTDSNKVYFRPYYIPFDNKTQKNLPIQVSISLDGNHGKFGANGGGDNDNKHHSSAGFSTLYAVYEGNSHTWNGQGKFLITKNVSQPYSVVLLHTEILNGPFSGIVVWLREGNNNYKGIEYTISSNYPLVEDEGVNVQYDEQYKNLKVSSGSHTYTAYRRLCTITDNILDTSLGDEGAWVIGRDNKNTDDTNDLEYVTIYNYNFGLCSHADYNAVVGRSGGGTKVSTLYTNRITNTESITSQTFIATSDKRLKENITPYTANNKSILDLPVYKYNFISDDSKKEHIGCLAQDLQEICPEIVDEGNDGYLAINESKIVYLLLEEIKKLKNRIDELEYNNK